MADNHNPNVEWIVADRAVTQVARIDTRVRPESQMDLTGAVVERRADSGRR